MLNIEAGQRNYLIVHIEPRALADLFRASADFRASPDHGPSLQFEGMPDDVQIHDVTWGHMRSAWAVTLYHPNFPAVPPGVAIPDVPIITRHRIGPSRLLTEHLAGRYTGLVKVPCDPAVPAGDRVVTLHHYRGDDKVSVERVTVTGTPCPGPDKWPEESRFLPAVAGPAHAPAETWRDRPRLF